MESQNIRAPYFDGETNLTRSRLIRAVNTVPHNFNAWSKLITKVDEERQAPYAASSMGGSGRTGVPESADFDIRSNSVWLLEASMCVIPQSSSKWYSSMYVSIWLNLALVHQ